MKTRALLPLLVLLVATATMAGEPAKLVRNGSGIRTKLILGTMYDLVLFVPADLKGANAKDILEADQPMELVLEIQSGLITRARFVEATSDGFAKAVKAGYASDQTQAFLEQFSETEFRKGDTVVMRYDASVLATLYRRNGDEKKLGEIQGLALKKALFAIWLGDQPVQESLKQGLLGGK